MTGRKTVRASAAGFTLLAVGGVLGSIPMIAG